MPKTFSAILSSLSEQSRDSALLKAYTNKLKELVDSKDQARLLAYIGKVPAFLEKSKPNGWELYLQEMAQLEGLLTNESPEEKEDRLKTLFDLIQSLAIADENEINNKLNEAYDQGLMTVINENTADHKRALQVAIETNNPNLIRALMKEGANFKDYPGINYGAFGNGATLLHRAADLNMSDLVVRLLEDGAIVDIKNAFGVTPLFISTIHSNNTIAALLLNKGANPHTQFESQGRQYSAFTFAIQNKNYTLAEAIFFRKPSSDYLLEVKQMVLSNKNDKDVLAFYKRLKQPYRVEKQKIIKDTPKFNTDQLAGPIRLIADNLYFHNHDLQREVILELNRLYNSCPILKPLLECVALATQGYRGRSRFVKNSPIKFIVKDTKQSIFMFNSDGHYNLGNSIYLSLKDPFYGHNRTGFISTIVGTLLHEIKHCVDDIIYGNPDMPYNNKMLFLQVKSHIIEQQSLLPFNVNKLEQIASSSIQQIFRGYNPKDQDAEIFVKVPEIIGQLGGQNGIEWLNKYLPAMIPYYEHRFNRACNTFIDSTLKDNPELAQIIREQNVEAQTVPIAPAVEPQTLSSTTPTKK